MKTNKKKEILSNSENDQKKKDNTNHIIMQFRKPPLPKQDPEKKPDKEPDKEPRPSFWKRCKKWYQGLEELDRTTFVSSLLLDPAFVVFLYYGITGIEPSIILTYLIIDPLVLWWWIASEKKRRARLAAIPENYTDYLRQMLAEMYADEDAESKKKD